MENNITIEQIDDSLEIIKAFEETNVMDDNLYAIKEKLMELKNDKKTT